jgi:GT2 family glycosyltransferase
MSENRYFSVGPNPSPTRRCLVALVHNGPVVCVETAISLMELGWGNRVETAKIAHGFSEIAFVWERSFPRVDAMRDKVMVGALAEGFSHVLFLDADMVWPTNTLERMLRHHSAGIVGGLYVLKAPPYSPVALGAPVKTEAGVTHYAFETDLGEDLKPVHVLGMGCTLIPTEVCAAIGPRPWFTYEDDADGWPRVSEDVPFCRKAKAAGFPILLDPTVSCGHATTQVIDERWHRRYQQSHAASRADVRVVEGAPV